MRFEYLSELKDNNVFYFTSESYNLCNEINKQFNYIKHA